MKILIATSTFPASECDAVPAFVKDQAINLRKLDPELAIVVHSPHSAYSATRRHIDKSEYYLDIRFHYFWPFKYELLAGRGIMPALRTQPLLYGQIPFFFLFQFLSLLRLTRQQKPTLLYAHWFTPQAMTTAWVSRLTGVPFVFTTHASDVSVLGRLPLAKRLVKWICRHASGYTAVSERTAGKLESFFEPAEWRDQFGKKLRIIPMGVDVQLTTPPQAAIDDTKEKYALDDRPTVMFLGRLAEKKGVADLLDATAILPIKTRNSFQLIIAGDGQLRHDLTTKAESLSLDNVTYTGHVHGLEKHALIALADCLCIPSIIDRAGDSEGFPVVLMEGLAAGKLIVASDVSGAETLFEGSDRTFLFPPNSPAELAECLARALALDGDEAIAVRERNRQLARKFSWSKISAEYHDFLNSAAQNGV